LINILVVVSAGLSAAVGVGSLPDFALSAVVVVGIGFVLVLEVDHRPAGLEGTPWQDRILIDSSRKRRQFKLSAIAVKRSFCISECAQDRELRGL
jgi:hypothetical protein